LLMKNLPSVLKIFDETEVLCNIVDISKGMSSVAMRTGDHTFLWCLLLEEFMDTNCAEGVTTRQNPWAVGVLIEADEANIALNHWTKVASATTTQPLS
jgi:hypothetical protein